MKKTILTFAITLGCTALTLCQNVQRTENGNFIATPKARALTDSTTTFTFTDSKGAVHPVYKGTKGGFYIGRISKKTGKYYRQYLKTEND